MNHEPPALAQARRCRAHSSRTGAPCRKAAIRRGSVCGSHGGRAGHVKMAARRRIAFLVDPALSVFERLLRPRNGDAVRPESQFAVARDVLDRAGLRAAGHEELPIEFSSGWVSRLSDEDLRELVKLLERLGMSATKN